jgi:hypothetical protein
MSNRKGAREVILQALGTIETEAQAGLSCVLSVMHAEAEMLAMGENLGPDSEVLELAHAARLKALENLIDDYMIASWRETAEEAKAAE